MRCLIVYYFFSGELSSQQDSTTRMTTCRSLESEPHFIFSISIIFLPKYQPIFICSAFLIQRQRLKSIKKMNS
jgi:hypothetical protein